LAFFDDEMSVDRKELMVTALSPEGKEEPCKIHSNGIQGHRYEEAIKFFHYK